MDLATLLRRAIPQGPGSELPFALGADAIAADWNGLARLSASQLVRPTLHPVTESASVWTPINVLDRTVRLFKPGERRIINYVQAPLLHSGADTLTLGLHGQSSLGYVDLQKGEWLINTPIVTAEGTKPNFVYQDVSMGNAFDAAGSVGTALSDVQTADAPTFVSIPNADTAILGVDAARKLIVLSNPDAAVHVWLRHGAAAAVAGSGIRVPAGGAIVIGDRGDAAIAGQALRGIATAAGPVLLGVQCYR